MRAGRFISEQEVIALTQGAISPINNREGVYFFIEPQSVVELSLHTRHFLVVAELDECQHVFASYIRDIYRGEDVWEQAEEIIAPQYDLSAVRAIYLSANVVVALVEQYGYMTNSIIEFAQQHYERALQQLSQIEEPASVEISLELFYALEELIENGVEVQFVDNWVVSETFAVSMNRLLNFDGLDEGEALIDRFMSLLE